MYLYVYLYHIYIYIYTCVYIYIYIYTYTHVQKELRLPRHPEAPDITVADTIPWELGPFLEKKGSV